MPADDRPTPDLDRVRETLRERDGDHEASADQPDEVTGPEDFEDDPSRNPQDPGLKDIKGG